MVCSQIKMEIFPRHQYSSSAFPMNFKKVAKMNNFIFNTDV